MKRLNSILICFFLFVISNASFGQAVYGNIIGTVTDSTGAAVANAPVIVTDLDRGASYKASSNASGNYEQTHLLAGHYKVSVSAPGFASFEATAEVQIDASTRLDVRLGVQG